MSKAIWRQVHASVIGTSHQKNATGCQDACACRVEHLLNDGQVLLAVISDGAGSACMAEVGAKLVVDGFVEMFSNKPVQEITKSFVLEWVGQMQERILIKAAEANLQSRDFACTVAGAIVGEESAVFFQVGDGAIIISDGSVDEYRWVFWPQHGEYANQTNFITQDNFSEVLMFEVVEKRISEIALFTDGLERLVLNFASKTVHAPAVKPIFAWLSSVDYNQNSSQGMAVYLGSSFINDRTDDDKTLVMATRVTTEI